MLALATLCLSACGHSEPPSEPAATPVPSTESAAAPAAAAAPTSSVLAGTTWRLVGFESMDDAQGTTTPHDRAAYVMRLNDDGTVNMRLNCNRATGTWKAEPGADGMTGTFAFGPLAMTRAMCPPPSMDETIGRQADYIRSFMLRDGDLYLSLMADGGIYHWEPDPDGGAGLTGDGAQD